LVKLICTASKSLAIIGQALKLGRSADRSVPQKRVEAAPAKRQILIQSEKGVYRFEDEAFPGVGYNRSIPAYEAKAVLKSAVVFKS